MKLLLDTHALLWWLDGDRQLSANARSCLANPENPVLVSTPSAWEIATKVRRGKLAGAVEVAERFIEVVREQDFGLLSISAEHARQAGLLPGDHRDSFDRMLIAQSQIEGLVLVSTEHLFDQFRIRRLW